MGTKMESKQHSYTSLKMYKNCPYNYYRQKILKDIKPVFQKQAEEGISVHKSIEDRLLSQTPLPEKINSLEPTCAAIESYEGTLFVEKAITIDSQLNPCDRWDEKRWLTSILDVMVKDDNKVYVIDWKTGRYWKDNFQMLIAANNILQTMPQVDTVLTSVRWLKTGLEDKQSFKRTQSKLITSEIRAVVHKIDVAIETNTWMCKQSGLCNYCPTKPECPLFNK